MKQYMDLANQILHLGNRRGDRTGTGTVSIFGPQLRFDLSKGFPLLTTKKMFVRGIIEELLWFLNGGTNNNVLVEKNVHIWDEWAAEDGSLGPVYGEQWRSWKGKVINVEVGTASDVIDIQREKIDQIAELITNLKKKPFSRRHVISAWNVEDLPDESISPQENVKNGKMALAPCHCLFQFYVHELSFEERASELAAMHPDYIEPINSSSLDDEIEELFVRFNIPKYKLDCQLYQRSADYILGVPFNIASYALLTMMIAQCCDMLPGEFIHTFGDCHIYNNHIDTFIASQMDNEPYQLPIMDINPNKKDIFSFTIDDFQLEDYKSHNKIDYPISI